MNGAEALVRTLIAGGVDTCFANPGTSEMHLVAAFDRVPGVRCVLGLFEGVVTGAADGYARMSERPAVTLLHLGPGLANGIANLHNARKAGTGMLNLVGEHATYHRRYDAPLTSDIQGLAAPVSGWLRTAASAATLSRDAAEGLAAARAGAIATLIVPADTAWGEGGAPAEVPAGPAAPPPPDEAAVEEAARRLRSGEPCVLMIGGAALRGQGLDLVARIAAATGARLFAPTSVARAERGAGRPVVERVPYRVARALETLAGTHHAILLGAPAPVAFFAYPESPSLVLPEGCETLGLAEPGADPLPALEALADRLGAYATEPRLQPRAERAAPAGRLTGEAIGALLAAHLPEGAVVADESISASFAIGPHLMGAAPFDHLQLTGGAIGIGLPLATGAALGAPGRKVVCLQADGSALYTPQALWTQAREGTDTLTILLANHGYATLHHELAAVGINQPGPNASAMFDLDRPRLDWLSLAAGMGVEGLRAETAEEFGAALAAGLAAEGPFLIEAAI